MQSEIRIIMAEINI